MGKLKKISIAFVVMIVLIYAVNMAISGESERMIPTSTFTVDNELIREKTYMMMNEQELEEVAIPWEYRDMLRNPENYRGEIISINGPVYFVSNSVENPTSPLYGSERGKQLLGFEIGGRHSQLIGVEHQGEKILKGDKVQIYAEFKKLYTGIPFPAGGEKPFLKSHFLECFNCN